MEFSKYREDEKHWSELERLLVFSDGFDESFIQQKMFKISKKIH